MKMIWMVSFIIFKNRYIYPKKGYNNNNRPNFKVV